jgi:hypothetical protein
MEGGGEAGLEVRAKFGAMGVIYSRRVRTAEQLGTRSPLEDPAGILTN